MTYPPVPVTSRPDNNYVLFLDDHVLVGMFVLVMYAFIFDPPVECRGRRSHATDRGGKSPACTFSISHPLSLSLAIFLSVTLFARDTFSQLPLLVAVVPPSPSSVPDLPPRALKFPHVYPDDRPTPPRLSSAPFRSRIAAAATVAVHCAFELWVGYYGSK